jgi:hypothetical protein
MRKIIWKVINTSTIIVFTWVAKNPIIVLQFTHQITHLSPSGLREPLFVGLGQKYGLEGRR